jgi:ABC-2 type transport system ATP-binding protein
MDEAEYCHRLALMYRGKVIALGTPDELKHSLVNHQIVHLEVSDVLSAMKTLEKLRGISDVAVFGGGLHVTTSDAGADIPRIRAALDTQGIAISELDQILPSMEDVFVAMIEQEERKAA